MSWHPSGGAVAAAVLIRRGAASHPRLYGQTRGGEAVLKDGFNQGVVGLVPRLAWAVTTSRLSATPSRKRVRARSNSRSLSSTCFRAISIWRAREFQVVAGKAQIRIHFVFKILHDEGLLAHGGHGLEPVGLDTKPVEREEN